MRRNKVGAFEIHFVSDEGTWLMSLPASPRVRRLSKETKTAAGRFKEVFYPAPASEPPDDGE